MFGGDCFIARFQPVDDSLHMLGLALADNQRCVVVIDNDQVLEPDAGDGPAAGMDKYICLLYTSPSPRDP